MIVIIGNKEAVRACAKKRKIDLMPERIAANDQNKPFTRRRLSDLRYGEILNGVDCNPDQAMLVSERDKPSFTLVLADYQDTEINFIHDNVPASLEMADLAEAVSSFIPARPWVGQHMDIRA